MHAIALGTRPQLGYRYSTTTHVQVHQEEILLEDLAIRNRVALAAHRQLVAQGLRPPTRRRPRAIRA